MLVVIVFGLFRIASVPKDSHYKAFEFFDQISGSQGSDVTTYDQSDFNNIRLIISLKSFVIGGCAILLGGIGALFSANWIFRYIYNDEHDEYIEHNKITRGALAELFQNNEVAFSSVAYELYSLGLNGVTFRLNDHTLHVFGYEENKITLSDDIQKTLPDCLRQMEQFLRDHNLSSFSASVSTRKMFDETLIVEFHFRDEKSRVDSGIVYSIEKINGIYKKLKNNWYFFS